LSPSFQQYLREEYANAADFSDGEIYRHIREAILKGDIAAKNKWCARFDSDKMRKVTQLSQRKKLQEAWDDLLIFPPLFDCKFLVWTLPRGLSLNCDEVRP